MSVNGTNNLRTIEILGGALWTGPQPDAEISNNVEMIILNALGKNGTNWNWSEAEKADEKRNVFG